MHLYRLGELNLELLNYRNFAISVFLLTRVYCKYNILDVIT